MTIQEKAIEWLTLLKEKFIGTEYSIYLDAAIQALKQQPSEDYISRQAAIDAVVFECGEWIGLAREISKQLRQLPPVTPQIPKGKWIQTKDDCDGVNFYDFSFKCSKCGKEQSFKSNYCPNCGSYNRGGEKC